MTVEDDAIKCAKVDVILKQFDHVTIQDSFEILGNVINVWAEAVSPKDPKYAVYILSTVATDFLSGNSTEIPFITEGSE